jgi:hypothetical protein
VTARRGLAVFERVGLDDLEDDDVARQIFERALGEPVQHAEGFEPQRATDAGLLWIIVEHQRLDGKGMPIAWNNRFAGSSVIARWLPPGFKDGLDPDTTEGAIDLVYDLPNFHVEYVRLEPPGIPTAFWRSVGPSHNVFVTESFMDELAAAAILRASPTCAVGGQFCELICRGGCDGSRG